MIDSAFCAGAAMISFGAILGKVSPTQLMYLLVLEVSLVFPYLDISPSLISCLCHPFPACSSLRLVEQPLFVCCFYLPVTCSQPPLLHVSSDPLVATLTMLSTPIFPQESFAWHSADVLINPGGRSLLQAVDDRPPTGTGHTATIAQDMPWPSKGQPFLFFPFLLPFLACITDGAHDLN